MNILITGAKGFIGSHLMNYLIKENTVIGTARNVYKEEKNYVEVDLSISFDVDFDADIVIHTAACCPSSRNNFIDYYKNNIVATQNVIDYSLKHNVKKIIYLAAVSSYGWVDKVLSEASPHNDPDEYGLTKYVAEKMIVNCTIPYLILALPGVIGKGCNDNWLVSTAKKLKTNKEIICYNKKGQFNNILAITDLCGFIDVLLSKNIINEKYILCTDSSLKVDEIIMFMYKELSSKSNIIWTKSKKNGFVIDNSKAVRDGFLSQDIMQILKFVCEEAKNTSC